MTESEWLASDDPQAMLRWLRYETGNGMADGPPMSFPRLTDRKLRLFACACARQVWHLLTDPRSRKAVEVAERFADGEATAEELDAVRATAWDAVVDAATDAAWAAAWTAVVDAARDAVRDAAWAAAGDAAWAAAGGAANLSQAALLRDIVGNPWRPTPDLWDKSAPIGAYGAVEGLPAFYSKAPWLTPQVVSLAQAAYDERVVPCGRCGGNGLVLDLNDFDTDARTEESCDRCHGTGIIDDGTLDPIRLAILADALEEAGCDNEPLLRHLRGWWPCRTCDGEGCHGEYMQNVCENCGGTGWARLYTPHVRGCWALDLILGRK